MLHGRPDGRVALITGGVRSIGAASAWAFTAEGAAVVHLDDHAYAKSLVAEIARTALLLASDAGAFHVGQSLAPSSGDVML